MRKHPTRFRPGFRPRLAAVAALGAVIVLLSTATPAFAASSPRLDHEASAYGTSIQLSTLFTSGPTALATLGCTTEAGLDHTNSAASADLLAAGSAGAINNEVTTTAESTVATSNALAVNLLSNLVTADAVTATATATKTASGFATSGSTTGVNVVVGGTPITISVPNTEIPLPGLGTLTLDEQISHVTSSSASMTVNALHVHIAVANPLGLAVGANIVVGHAHAVLQNKLTRTLDGKAYATEVDADVVAAGRTAVVHLPCEGTNGAVRTNTTAGVSVPGVLSSGTATSTATGTVSKSTANGITTDTIQNVSLLGIVSATVIKAEAHASATGPVKTFNDNGSSFEHLSVLGVVLPPNPIPPNTQLPIPGIGTLYLHRVIRGTNHIEVRMIELVVTSPGGVLPLGADIRIGVAEASVH